MTTNVAPSVPLLLTDTDLMPAHSADAFALHRAACQWQLDVPLLIQGEADLLTRGRIDVTPYAHQVRNLITFCRRAPVALLADDVGLGKTISAGLILAELYHRRRVRKALVVCPNILMTQWEGELIDKFRLPVVMAKGRKLQDAAESIERGVVVTTYETARDHVESVGNAGFQMLILDEAHRLRRLHGSDTPPQVATAMRSVLERRWFKYVLLLTATPIQNSLWDLYSLIELLAIARGHPHPLGTPDEFAATYVRGPRDRAVEIQSWRVAELRKHVHGYITRTRRAEAGLLFPTREVRLRRVDASEDERQLVDLLGRHLDKLEPLMQVSLAQALMSSPQAFVAQVEHMLPKARHLSACLAQARSIVADGRPAAKLVGLGVVVRELREARPEDWRLVVFTGRLETQRAIGSFLEEQGIAYGFIRGGQAAENRAAIDQFCREYPDVNVLVSTEAGGEGLNLQAANVLVNYDLPWNPMVMEQRIGRIQRLGSAHASVTIINLVVRDSVEERIVARLSKKLQLINDAAFEIDAILESAANADADGDAGVAFEEMIGRLVVESLKDKDVDEALRREEASLDEARRLFLENQEVIEAQLRGLDTEHGIGPRPPDLPLPEPLMPIEEFVIGALHEEGAILTETSSGRLDVEIDGAMPFEATFGASDADPRPIGVRVYAPGEPDFEALAARWASRDAALLYDHGGGTDNALRTIAERWCSQIPGATLVDVQRLDARSAFQGEIESAAKAVVAHDGYERMVCTALLPDGHAVLPWETEDVALVDTSVRVAQLAEGAMDAVASEMSDDSAIGAFVHFYEQRRLEELEHAETEEAQRRVEHAFTPTVTARVVSVRGHRYAVVRVALTIGVDTEATYETELEVIPATAQIVAEPEQATCEQSGRRVPVAWLASGRNSRKRVLRHLLEPVALVDGSHPGASSDELVCSALTGRRMPTSALVASAVSGALAEPDLLVTSEMSGRRGLPSETARCAFTGATVLVDELVQSELSAGLLRADQKAVSAISGKVGHVSEFVLCAASATFALPDEVERSDVSGQMVRKDWLVASDQAPHRRGSKLEARRCDKTGKLLLLDEGAYSHASLRWVDRSLLVQSQVSELVALEEELVACELSGKRVLAVETAVCAVTGRRARCDLLVQSAASNRYMVAGNEVRSAISGRPMAPSEAFMCPWLGIAILPEEAQACVRTGLKVASTALNAEGELAELRHILDHPDRAQPAPEIAAWLQSVIAPPFRVVRAVAVDAPSGKLRAVVARCERFIFRHFLGCVVAGSALEGTLSIAGAGYTVGYLNPNGWIVARDVRAGA